MNRRKSRPRAPDRSRPYDKLATTLCREIESGGTVDGALERLRFSGDRRTLAHFLTALLFVGQFRSENPTRPDYPTSWTFVLPLEEAHVRDLPGLLLDCAKKIAILGGSSLDPARVIRDVDSNWPEFPELLRAVEQFRSLPRTLELYAGCLRDISRKRQSWKKSRIKLPTLHKALLVRYLGESSSAGDVHQEAVALLDWASAQTHLSHMTVTAEALRKIEKRAVSWTGDRKNLYDSVFENLKRQAQKQAARGSRS